MEIRAEVEAAARRIGGRVRRTPMEASASLSAESGARVHLKLENLQRTGSFKLRGATNKLLCLEPAARERGVVAASTGNHGAAVACAAGGLGVKVTVFAPHGAAPGKLAAMGEWGAEVRLVGNDCLVAEQAARAFAAESGRAYISPYNDLHVIAGQGTLAVELLEDLPELEAVVIAVGGGGLIGGVGAYLKALRPKLKVIGVSPRASAAMAASIRAGRVVEVEHDATLSDGTAGGLEQGALTLELCAGAIDEFVLVDEPAIADGMRRVIGTHHTLIEGAAGAAVAGVFAAREILVGLETAVVLCGSNVDPAVLKRVL
jgi:threonine dehydratase